MEINPSNQRLSIPHFQAIKKERVQIWPYYYLAPALIIFSIFLFFPLFKTLQISLYNWNLISPNRTFVGLDNYLSLIVSPNFWKIVWQSVLYMIAALLGNFLFPLVLALLTTRFSDLEAGLYQSLIFVPTVVPVSIGALIWLWIYLPTGGPLSVISLALFKTPLTWLNDPSFALWAVAIVTTWKFMGFNYLFLLAGLKAIPKSFLEAAKLDGAKGWRLQGKIILPLLTPTLLFVFLTTILQALDNSFVPIQILTLGGPVGSTTHLLFGIYQDGFRFFRAGQASAMAVVSLLFLAGAIIWQFRLLDQKVNYER
ncbi:MAG: carbohydrate ABC transporter permease [Cyanophyceae cyanobacterium]